MKLLKWIAYIAAYAIAFIVAFWAIDFIKINVKNYPNTGYYYIDYDVSENEIFYDIKYTAYITNNHNFYNDNIKIYPSLIGSYNSLDSINFKKFVKNETLSIILLKNGHASIIDTAIATNDELKAQNYAIKKKNGIWGTDEFIEGETIKEPLFKRITNWCIYMSKKWWVKFLILPLFSITSIISLAIYIYKKVIMTKRIVLFFVGDISSGKTTLKTLFMNPDSSEQDLLEQTPTRGRAENRFLRDSQNRRITITGSVLDIPGGEYHQILDELHKNISNNIKNYYIIYMLAPTPLNNSNELDNNYIDDQLMTIKKLWSAVLQSTAIKHPKKIIIFINKVDLFNKSNLKKKFNDHIKLLKKYAHHSTDTEVIIGSSTQRIGFSKMLNNIF